MYFLNSSDPNLWHKRKSWWMDVWLRLWMEVMFSYQKLDQWSPPLSDQQGEAQSRSGCWVGQGHNWSCKDVIMGTWNQSIFIIATFFTIRLPLVCTHISWHDKTFHDHDYDESHLFSSHDGKCCKASSSWLITTEFTCDLWIYVSCYNTCNVFHCNDRNHLNLFLQGSPDLRPTSCQSFHQVVPESLGLTWCP